MSLQTQLNADVLAYLPAIKNIIKEAEAFEANQMSVVTFRECMNSNKAIDQMNAHELLNFQARLIRRFEFSGWIQS